MKDEWTRIHLSIAGKRESPNEVELKEFNADEIFGCPTIHLANPVEDAPAINGLDAPPVNPLTALMGEGNELDMFGGLGIETARGVVVIRPEGFTLSTSMAQRLSIAKLLVLSKFPHIRGGTLSRRKIAYNGMLIERRSGLMLPFSSLPPTLLSPMSVPPLRYLCL